MNNGHGFEKKLVKSIIESFKAYFKKQEKITVYPEELIESRIQIVNWLIFLCNNISFRKETLYRAITIYDLYISKRNEN